MNNSALYFNEFKSFPAQWIRNYFNKEVTVDERSIHEINPDELVGFQRVHLFAGIAGWEIALRQAGWPTDVPVWSGSCPCQPFSAAGLGKGTADNRHLWPEFFRLIAACRPPHIFGEQVSGKKVTGKLFTPREWERIEPEARRAAEEADNDVWFRHVQTDLERVGYIVGHCVFPAASVGGPHARQRLYWYARYAGDSDDTGLERRAKQSAWEERPTTERAGCVSEQLADLHQDGRDKIKEYIPEAGGDGVERDCTSGGVADMCEAGLKTSSEELVDEARSGKTADAFACGRPNRSGPTNGFWRTVDWIFCRDDKWRPDLPRWLMGYQKSAPGWRSWDTVQRIFRESFGGSRLT